MKLTRSPSARWGLALASLALTYLFFELVAFRVLLHHVPLKLHGYLPKEVRLLAQPSKRGTIPRDYVALVGDSYARGFGDWFLDASPWRNEAFHSADLIHEATGRDVIALGASGAGSLRGLVSTPIGQLSYLAASPLHRLEPPRVFLVYFYGGNDLNNNLEDLRLRFPPSVSRDDVRDREVFRRLLTTVVLERDSSWAAAKTGLGLTERLFFLRTLKAIWDGAPPPIEPERIVKTGINRVRVRSEVVTVPDRLQGPSLELDGEEIALGAYVFEEALLFLRRHFPGSDVRVVYVPSPLECYEIVSPEVDTQSYERRRTRYRPEEVEQQHRIVVTAVRQAAERNGVAFLDATPRLRAAARLELVHGPRDWKHFNRVGYEALTAAALDVLAAGG